ncbi:hypothetical protein AYO21_03863 [Fonsecaea monophora]|uniref:Mid2 domain-containing protein n=1 Tax=Fonsecaea monophora TaxID=254056 RepID=A0A177FE44_9EURO|nr:hypothetical protein AYO21_03863 [Fonsecaea monophora]OAG41860.1 hypothetical protein AYO21_03863 [Fonsecaea monophora]
MRTATLITALFVAVLCGVGFQTADPPPFHGVGFLTSLNGSIQTSSDGFLANLPTKTPTPVTAAPPPSLAPAGLPFTLSTFIFSSSAMAPVPAPPVETTTVTATSISTTTALESSTATAGPVSTSSSSITPTVLITTITVLPLPATPTGNNSYTTANKTTSDLPGATTSATTTPLTTATSNSTGAEPGEHKTLSHGQKLAAIIAPILGLFAIAIAAFVGYWLRTRRLERQRADRLEQRARWFRQDHNDWIRAQMSSFDDSKIGRNPIVTPAPSYDTICRPRTRPRQFSGSTVVVNRSEEAFVDRVVRRRGAVENLRD